MVQNHKLLVCILTPIVESVKEHLTIDLLTINKCTVLGSDMHHRITLLSKLLSKISLRQQTNDMLGCLSADQDLVDRIVLNGLEKILTVTLSNILTLHREAHLRCNHLRRNDITILHQFRSRNFSDNATVDLTIIHTCLTNHVAVFWSCSKEVATLCLCGKILHSRKEVTLNAVVCLIKVNRIYLDLSTLQLLQRVIGGEDEFVTRSVISKPSNITGFCGRIVMRLTSMNVHHSSICDKLQILTGELLCQQNTGSNHYDGFGGIRFELLHSIKNTHVGLTAACGKDAHPFGVLLESIQGDLLMGAKLNHVLGCV